MQALNAGLITTDSLHDLAAMRIAAYNKQAILLEHGLTAFEVQQTSPVGLHGSVRVQLSPMPSRHTRTAARPGKLGASARQM